MHTDSKRSVSIEVIPASNLVIKSQIRDNFIQAIDSLVLLFARYMSLRSASSSAAPSAQRKYIALDCKKGCLSIRGRRSL